jgi:hypothetical protein
MTFDDELIGAYLDGELNEIIRLRLEEAAHREPALRERLQEQERLRSRLEAHFAPALAEDVPERLIGLLKTSTQSEVVPIEPARARRAAGRLWVPAAMAASLAAGLVGGQLLRSGGRPVVDPLIPQGQIAQALDTQLASSQPPDAAVKVGVTFRGTDGQICRTFDGAQAGFACRQEDQWRLQLLAPGAASKAGEFAQASGASVVVMQAAQEAMSGDPLDHEQERQAQSRGWR